MRLAVYVVALIEGIVGEVVHHRNAPSETAADPCERKDRWEVTSSSCHFATPKWSWKPSTVSEGNSEKTNAEEDQKHWLFEFHSVKRGLDQQTNEKTIISQHLPSEIVWHRNGQNSWNPPCGSVKLLIGGVELSENYTRYTPLFTSILRWRIKMLIFVSFFYFYIIVYTEFWHSKNHVVFIVRNYIWFCDVIHAYCNMS